jgi:hypothetical protein|tara:strand:+ start:61 stop:342 length:282 start_codon:yes stop_codon:yes gene_type:complete
MNTNEKEALPQRPEFSSTGINRIRRRNKTKEPIIRCSHRFLSGLSFLVFLSSLLVRETSALTDPNDLLEGKGLFETYKDLEALKQDWTLVDDE